MSTSTTAEVSRTERTSAITGLLLLEGALAVCWSSGFVGVRFAIDYAPVFLILLWRSLASGLVLLPFAVLIGPRLRLRAVAVQAAIGTLAMSGYLAGFAIAIDHGVPTGLVALIADMLPLAVAMLSMPILGQIATGRQWLGFAIGFGGVVIASAGALHVGNATPWAYLMPVLGMLSLALATLLHKRFVKADMPVHQSLCIQCLSAAAIFALFAWREGSVLPITDWGFVAGILWLVVLATFGGYGLYYLCLRKSSPARVSSVLYLSPPVTMVWAWAMFAEPLSWVMVIGLVVSLAGIVIAARSGPQIRTHGTDQAT